MAPSDPEVQDKVHAAVTEAIDLYRAHFLSPAGYQSPRYQQRYKDFCKETSWLDDSPLLATARRLLGLVSNDPRNDEVEGVIRILTVHDANH